MKKKAQGFALIQTIVAIVVLAIALSGAVVLMGTVINETAVNKNRITAIYLAQECLELARNARDSAWKQNLPWDCAFPDKSGTYRIWSEIDAFPGAGITACNNQLGMVIDQNGPPFNLALEEGRIFHETTWNPGSEKNMIFQRSLSISDVRYQENDPTKPPQSMTITCQVTWPQKGSDGEINISEILTNWQK